MSLRVRAESVQLIVSYWKDWAALEDDFRTFLLLGPFEASKNSRNLGQDMANGFFYTAGAPIRQTKPTLTRQSGHSFLHKSNHPFRRAASASSASSFSALKNPDV
jgi:hypothetical protein